MRHHTSESLWTGLCHGHGFLQFACTSTYHVQVSVGPCAIQPCGGQPPCGTCTFVCKHQGIYFTHGHALKALYTNLIPCQSPQHSHLTQSSSISPLCQTPHLHLHLHRSHLRHFHLLPGVRPYRRPGLL